MASPLPKPAADPLAALRDRLDEVDLAVHRLLRERFEIVTEIGATKGPDASVMRPAREAAVLENRLAVHTGAMPAETLAHIVRVVIAAGCAVQRAYTVHVAGALDAARFLYGPVAAKLHADSAAAVAALAENPGDVAVVALDAPGRWWASRAKTHAIGLVRQSDGRAAVVLGGAGVAPGSGPVALVVRGDALAEVRTADLTAADDCLGRFHPFPLTIAVAR